jgi:peptide chain release factor
MLDKSDVIESFVRSSGPGGQNVNKVESCVQLVHKPSGIVVKCQKFRTQHQNRQEAWQMLSRALNEHEQRLILARRSALEKRRRQNRKRSAAAKQRMLESKKKNSQRKQNRKGVTFNE